MPTIGLLTLTLSADAPINELMNLQPIQHSVLAAAFLLCALEAQAADRFILTDTLHSPRVAHTATLLANGEVLICGGGNGSIPLSSAEVYNPTTKKFRVVGDLRTARHTHRAVLLPSGKVLIAGGESESGALSSAELYDPVTEMFSSAGSMGHARTAHTATRLEDGTILITGGSGAGGPEDSAEIYNPATGTFLPTAGPMVVTRRFHTATLLASGKVLITGGYHPSSAGGGGRSEAELYDPARGTFSPTANQTIQPRNVHSASLLPGGSVLLTGGFAGFISLNGAELYQPGSGLFVATGDLLQGRLGESSTVLPSGLVLVAGGEDYQKVGPLKTSEIYDAGRGSFRFGPEMNDARWGHTATLLNDGTVLLAGGNGAVNRVLASSELFLEEDCPGLTEALETLDDLRSDLKEIVADVEKSLGRKLPGRNTTEKLRALSRSIRKLTPAQRQPLIKGLK